MRWIVTDNTTFGSADLEVLYRPHAGALATDQPHVLSVQVRTHLTPSEVRLRDYDYRKPAYPLDRRSMSVDGPTVEDALVRYSFAVGRFDDDYDGDLLAGRRLEQARWGARTYHWETSVALRAGTRIRLHDHPSADANGDFLVVSARAEAHAGGRRHRATLIPAGVPWRPEVRAKPRIQGTQTAFVVGAPGKEIDIDAEGRILVRFPWDMRTGGSSRRVRVAMPWMGTQRGFWTPPRVGDEVTMDYLDGDPDEPLVVGSVHNALTGTPLRLPAEKTQSVWRSRSSPGGQGFNEIRMEDAAGAEVLSVRAERDFRQTIGHDRTVEVGNDDFTLVRHTHMLGVAHAEGDQVASLFMRDKKIVLDTGAGAALTMEGDKITLEATTIELLARDFLDFQGKKRGIGLQTPVGATNILGPEFLYTGDRFAVGVGTLATINAPSVNVGGESVSIVATGTADIAGTPVQINGPGPFAGRVTETAPATITTGAALVLIGGASFPLPVEKQPNGDLKIGKAMLVKGDAAFQNKMLARLGVVSGTPSGNALLASIDGSGKTMSFAVYKGDNSFATPHDFVAATPKGQPVFDGAGKPLLGPDGKQLVGTGTGSDVTVDLNPDLTLPNNQDPDHPMPNDAVLFHEMSHGDHQMRGTYDGTPDSTFDTNEEKTTILTGKPSEADYNKERNYPYHRTDHDLTFVAT